jgi:tetratricopeptide (TPR) repeat protein
MRLLIITTLILLSHFTSVLGQGDAYLDQLDSIAFYALEHGDSSVIQKANTLLTESSKKKSASFYAINAHTILGIVHKDKGYYLTSLDHYLKALNSAEQIKDKGRISACYNNIGNVYLLQENYQKACIYFYKSLVIEEKLNKPLQKSIRLYNLGDAYSKLDSFDLALSYFTNSLLIEKKLNNVEGVIYAQLGIANVYIKNDRLTDAQYLLKKINQRVKKHQIEETILYHLLKGQIHLKRNDHSLSLENFNRAESISFDNNFRIHLLDIYLLKIAVYKELKDWKNATSVYDQFEKLKDELNTAKVKNQLEDMTFQNELTKKELEIQLIQEEKNLAVKNQQLEKAAANHRSKIVWFLILTFILLFGLIFIGIRKLAKEN